MGVAARLGAVCRQARQAADLTMLEIAQAAGVSQTTISDFELGQAWPRRIDDVVAAYEAECSLDVDELWRRAIDSG